MSEEEKKMTPMDRINRGLQANEAKAAAEFTKDLDGLSALAKKAAEIKAGIKADPGMKFSDVEAKRGEILALAAEFDSSAKELVFRSQSKLFGKESRELLARGQGHIKALGENFKV